MRVIPPMNLYGSAVVTSSTINEPDTDASPPEAVWNSGTTYAVDAQVINATTHRKYVSLRGSNLNNALPNYTAGEMSNTWWLDIGATNKWAMFDLFRNTPSRQNDGTTELEVVLIPGRRVDSITLMALNGQSVQIVGTSVLGGGTVYDSGVIPIRSRNVTGWYSYFFTPFSSVASVVRFDIPPYSDIHLTVTITDAGGGAACGELVLGTSAFIGNIEFDPVSDAINFSVVSRDAFGNATLTPRRSIPKTTQKVWAPASLIDSIRALRVSLNAVPAVWCGFDDLTSAYGETMLIFGFYRTWTINLSAADAVEQSLEIEEL